MFKEKITINSNDVDKFLNLKVSSFFKFFQQVSTDHSEIIHVGTADTFDKGLGWVVVRMEVKIYDYPKMNDEIIVATHPGETRMIFYPRFYEMYSKKGKLLASGSSLWVVLDKKTRRVVSNPFNGRIIKGEKCEDDIPLPEKVLFSELNKVEDRRVRNSDIDLNAHLNNTKYIDFILDTKEPEFFDNYLLSGILINFEKEVKEGEVVELFTNKDGDIVQGKLNGAECFTAQLEFKKR